MWKRTRTPSSRVKVAETFKTQRGFLSFLWFEPSLGFERALIRLQRPKVTETTQCGVVSG